MVEPVGIVVQVDRGQAFVAREALRDRVITVRAQLHELPTLDMGHEPARRLTDPAERAHIPHGSAG
jgi:hypothetical protein